MGSLPPPRTPLTGRHSAVRQCYFQTYCKTCDTTSPSSIKVAAHMKAETKLANWKRHYGISKMPATSGTAARSGPEKRAMKIPSTPHFLMNASPFGISSGYLDRGQMF